MLGDVFGLAAKHDLGFLQVFSAPPPRDYERYDAGDDGARAASTASRGGQSLMRSRMMQTSPTRQAR
jgi:hypothetical protein